MRRTIRALSFLCFVATAPFVPAKDAKEFVNPYIRAIRNTQNTDGSYGPAEAQPITTARFLIALGTSSEKYVVTDGPFVRNAVNALVAQQDADGGFGKPSAKGRVAASAESFLALAITARLGFDEVLVKGRKFLETIPAEKIAAENAAEVVRLALSGRIEGTPYAARLAGDAKLDAAGAWIKPFVAGLEPAIEADLNTLETAGVPAAVDRLLALLDVMRAEDANKSPAGAAAAKPAVEVKLLPAPKDAPEQRKRIEMALAWLGTQQKDGRFRIKEQDDPGFTAIALAAAIKSADHLKIDRPAYVTPGLDWLASLQKPEDGAIYILGLKNYITSIAVQAFAASGDAKYAPVLEKAVAYLKSSQLDEDVGYSSENDPYYGGFGYGSALKPDLSNTQFAMQALHDAGVKSDDDSFRKAVDFLQRCQNRAESGAVPIAAGDGSVVVAGNDGGALYRPGDSKAGTDPANPKDPNDRRVIARSYGSMTYSLLKCYLFAGLDKNDPRVKAAFDWICANYTLEHNPGFRTDAKGGVQYQGLYYYYLSMARALKAFGATTITDGEGVAHDWRKDLSGMLYGTQSTDGSWRNSRSSRWMEEDPVLVTSYVLIALSEI